MGIGQGLLPLTEPSGLSSRILDGRGSCVIRVLTPERVPGSPIFCHEFESSAVGRFCDVFRGFVRGAGIFQPGEVAREVIIRGGHGRPCKGVATIKSGLECGVIERSVTKQSVNRVAKVTSKEEARTQLRRSSRGEEKRIMQRRRNRVK